MQRRPVPPLAARPAVTRESGWRLEYPADRHIRPARPESGHRIAHGGQVEMTEPTTPDRQPDDLWRPGLGFGSGTTSTQPLPVTASVDDPSDGPAAPFDRPPAPPGTARALPRRVHRPFGSMLLELTLAALVSAAVAAAMGWRVLSHLDRMVPGNGADPFIELWSMAWSGHALRPGSGIPITQVFDGNAFYPADYSL